LFTSSQQKEANKKIIIKLHITSEIIHSLTESLQFWVVKSNIDIPNNLIIMICCTTLILKKCRAVADYKFCGCGVSKVVQSQQVSLA